MASTATLPSHRLSGFFTSGSQRRRDEAAAKTSAAPIPAVERKDGGEEEQQPSVRKGSGSIASRKADRHSIMFGQQHQHQHQRPPGPRKLNKRRAQSTSSLPTLKEEPRQQERDQNIRDFLAAGARKPGHPAMASTVTIQPIQTHFSNSSSSALDLEPIQEDEQQPPSPTVSSPRSIYSAYPTYNGLRSSNRRPSEPITQHSAPMNAAPRRMSDGSTASTVSTMYTRESVRSEMMRTSSWGSKSSFESLANVNPNFAFNKPPLLKRRRTAPLQPGELFDTLPGEVLELILDALKRLHLGGGSDSCATCWMRDVCNVAVASLKWSQYARNALYQDIQLVGPDSAAQKKRFKLAQGTRMLMLRRTLRANPGLASIVRSLKVPRPDMTVKGWNAKAAEQYEDTVASVVMACPNLERLSGPAVGYDHSFKRILHALSTRAKLKEMDWLIEQSPTQRQKGGQGKGKNALVTPGDLEPFQEAVFLDYHSNWSQLASLSVHCLPGAALTPDKLLTKAIASLPSLEHLHLCNLPANAFNDKTLLALPPRLKTLSLTHITGISSSGVSSFATCAGSQKLETLHLRHTPLTSLAALARILSNLPNLTCFSLVQAFAPLMPEADSFALWMMPYLASATIKKLHWDITSHRSSANVADDILARSIGAGGFPRLRYLRTPNDPEAIFQQLCRPVERIDLPADRFTCGSETPVTPSDVVPPSPGRFLSKSPKSSPNPQSPMSSEFDRPPPCTDLRVARLAAQSRLEEAWHIPRFGVNVLAEDGTLVDQFGLGGYVGTVGSSILYHLLPDAGATDEKGGVVDARDLTGDAGESLASGREGCIGAWNQVDGVVADKKEKEKWWHTERGRWTRIQL